jgi:hypothetical protein
MEYEGALSSSKQPATSPCLEPDESDSRLSTPPLKISFNITLSSTSRSCKLSPLLQAFPSNLICIFLFPHTNHILCLSHTPLFRNRINIRMSRISKETHISVFFSILLLFSQSQAQYLP